MVLKHSVILDRWSRYDRFCDIGVVVSGASTIGVVFAEWFAQFSHPNILYEHIICCHICCHYYLYRFLYKQIPFPLLESVKGWGLA